MRWIFYINNQNNRYNSQDILGKGDRMRCLVTGAAGFIGSHLVGHLLSDGHDVRAFVHYNSTSTWGWLEHYVESQNDKLEICAGDIRDFDAVSGSMKGVDAVFHLAALIGIPYSYVSPLAYVKTNIEGTYNVLQAARENGVSRVVHTSTSEVYGTAQYVPIDERHPINPQSPYAASKASADFLALSFHRSFGLPVTVVRPFNTYGPRQSARAVIPTIVTQLLSGKTTLRLGNLFPTRDLTYVSDTVQGFIRVGIHKNTVGETLNLGTGHEISIGDLARKIATILEVPTEVLSTEERSRPATSEVERLLSNPEKSKRLSGWYASVPLYDGLAQTIEWLRSNMKFFKSNQYTI